MFAQDIVITDCPLIKLPTLTELPTDAEGQLWSEVLQLWLGVHESSYLEIQRTWLRFFDKSGQLVPLFGEAATQRAEAEAQRAEAEAQRADHAEAEVARLQAQLEKLRGAG